MYQIGRRKLRNALITMTALPAAAIDAWRPPERHDMGILGNLTRYAAAKAVDGFVSEKFESSQQTIIDGMFFPYKLIAKRRFSSSSRFDVKSERGDDLFVVRVSGGEHSAHASITDLYGNVMGISRSKLTKSDFFGISSRVVGRKYSISLDDGRNRFALGCATPDTSAAMTPPIEVDFKGWRISGTPFGRGFDVFDSSGGMAAQVIEASDPPGAYVIGCKAPEEMLYAVMAMTLIALEKDR